MKIGILGGTFDPVHNGHLELARAAKRQLELDKVLLIPANQPPHKDQGDITASPEERCAMLSLAISDEPGLEISRLEIDRGKTSFTVDTLREVKRLYPSGEIYLIMGEDSLKGFPAWHCADEITRLARLVVARRPGSRAETSLNVIWLKAPEIPVSSSEVRERGREESYLKVSLPERVLNYIREKSLYSKRT